MNLLTGRIERQSERWDLSRCSPPAAAAWSAARALWAAKQAGGDAGRKVNSTLDSLASVDEEEFQQPNPNDPMKVCLYILWAVQIRPVGWAGAGCGAWVGGWPPDTQAQRPHEGAS